MNETWFYFQDDNAFLVATQEAPADKVAVNNTLPQHWKNITTLTVALPRDTRASRLSKKIRLSVRHIYLSNGSHVPSWFQMIVFESPFDIQQINGTSSIADRAFSFCGNIKSLHIHEKASLKLGESAFANSSITAVDTSKLSRLLLNESAFEGAIHLVYVNCRGIIKTAERAFANCTALETVIVHPESILFQTESEFQNCTSLQQIQSDVVQDGVVQDGVVQDGVVQDGVLKNVRRIASTCLYGAVNLSKIPTMPNCTEIRYLAMEGCRKLSLTKCIPNVAIIGDGALAECQFERVPNEQNLQVLSHDALRNNNLLKKFVAGPNLDVCLNFCANCENIQHINLFKAKSSYSAYRNDAVDDYTIKNAGLKNLKCFVLPGTYAKSYSTYPGVLVPSPEFVKKVERDFSIERNSYYAHLLFMSWIAHANSLNLSEHEHLQINIVEIFKNMKLANPNSEAWDNVNSQYNDILVSYTTLEYYNNGNQPSFSEQQILTDYVTNPEIHPQKLLNELLETLGWVLEETIYPHKDEIDIKGKSQTEPYIRMSVYSTPPSVTLSLDWFFYRNKPDRDAINKLGRTTAGVGMQLVYLVAKTYGCQEISLTDSWSSPSNKDTTSSALQDTTEEKYIKRGKQYGFKTPEQLEKFTKRTKENGFYGAWGFKGTGWNKFLNVDDYIPTRNCFI